MYALMKKYGETSSQTEIREAGFQWILEDYPIGKIEWALKEYLKTGKTIPVPSDILEILDPKTQPLSEAVYRRLIAKQSRGDYLDTTEWAFVRKFEGREYRKI